MIGVYVGLNVLTYLLGLLCVGIAATRVEDRRQGALLFVLTGFVLLSAAVGTTVTLT